MSKACAILAAAALALALPAGGAGASPMCKLMELASLDMTTEADGEVSVPATIDGHSGLLLVDTGGVQSILGETVASQFGFAVQPSPNRYVLFGGVHLYLTVMSHSFELGGMRAVDMPLLLAPFTALHNDDIGVLAPDIMSNYDVELDFVHGKFNLFEPSFCQPTPVYWTADPIAVVPFEIDRDGHIMITIELDGRSLTAGVDTGADRTTMTMAAFERTFDKRPDDPALLPEGETSINGARATQMFRYPFKAMTFEGILVTGPNVDIVKTGAIDDRGGPDIILGIETLRQLRMYIAYKAQKVYLTPAEAH